MNNIFVKQSLQMKNKIFFALISMLFITALSATVLANEGITVIVYDEEVNFTGALPQTIGDYVLIPARDLFQSLGFYVSWNSEEQSIILTREDYVIVLVLNQQRFTINGEPHMLTIPVQSVDGYTMVMIFYILENIGYDVSWDRTTNTILITSPLPLTYTLLILLNEERDKLGLDKLLWNEDLASTIQRQFENDRWIFTQDLMASLTFASTLNSLKPTLLIEHFLRNEHNRNQLLRSDVIEIGIGYNETLNAGGNPQTRILIYLKTPTEVSIDADPFMLLNMIDLGTFPISALPMPNRRLTATERQAWIDEYWSMGGASAFELEVVRLVSELRLSLGLSPVAIDNSLMMAARYYTQITANLYFQTGHNNGPYARNPGAVHGASLYIAESFGANMIWGGGNAVGQRRTPQAVVDAWYNSPPHRDYMLSPEHRFIGFGSSIGGLWDVEHYMFLSSHPSN